MPNRAATMPDDRAGPDWIRLDRLNADLGEDVGRFPDGPLDPLPRIRGLGTIAECRGWDGAARRIASIRNREPDQAVLDALAQREATLDGRADEPGRRDLYHEPKTWYLNGEPWDEVDRAGALETLGRRDQQVAADGGADRGE